MQTPDRFHIVLRSSADNKDQTWPQYEVAASMGSADVEGLSYLSFFDDGSWFQVKLVFSALYVLSFQLNIAR